MGGFNKVGLSVGGGVDFDLSSNWTVKVDMLYSQRGSRSELFPNNEIEPIEFIINYASVPLRIAYKDWPAVYYGNPIHKIHFEAGFDLGWLVKSSINGFEPGQNEDVDELLDAYSKFDISWLIGFSFHFDDRWGMSFRYTRSIIPIYDPDKDPGAYGRSLLPFFLTFQAIRYL